MTTTLGLDLDVQQKPIEKGMTYTIYSAIPGRKCDALGRPLRDGTIFPIQDDVKIPPGETMELVPDLAGPEEVVIRWQGSFYNVLKSVFENADKDPVE